MHHKPTPTTYKIDREACTVTHLPTGALVFASTLPELKAARAECWAEVGRLRELDAIADLSDYPDDADDEYVAARSSVHRYAGVGC